MKLFGTIAAVLLMLLGLVWTLQGANILGGSVMSGQSQWLYIGIVVLLAGAALLFWLRRSRP
jgi:Mg2+ and Co2+ transporter CorA